MTEREIVNTVRDALRVYFEQRGAAPATLIAELEQEAAAGLRTIQILIDGMAGQERVWLANGVKAMLAAGLPVGGSLSNERWLEIQALFLAFGAWLKTPLEIVPPAEGVHDGVYVPPVVIVSRRSNPPAGWGIIPAPAPETLPDPDPVPADPAAE